VAQRTAELARANAEQERINAELNRRVEAESAARAKAQAELFQMQKLEAIGQLTGGIAHDFNNLLMVIINGLQMLTQSRSPAQRERALRRTQEASWRAAELTRRLLAFARRQPLHPQRIDLPRQIDTLRELLGQGLRDDIQLRTDVAADLWPLEIDLGALELTLLNLTVNARDAMPNGGMLTITARNRPLDEPGARRYSLPPGDYVEVAVDDTGLGMAPAVLERVFEPFFTTKGGSGTGLGLAQVYGFAQQSGGTACIESRPGEGTTVRLLLPRSHREPEPAADAGEPPEIEPRGELRVLVVEDEPAVGGVVLEMLAQLGHRGTCVPTVAAALASLAGTEPTDLVLTDVLLPGGDSGLDLAREVRERRLGVPVILTSGYGGSMTQRLSAMNLPFLRKPYRLETLRQAIDAALRPPAPGSQLPATAARG
jgi:signal transduction histidine kinase/ActR/RegA family two-component response regulator